MRSDLDWFSNNSTGLVQIYSAQLKVEFTRPKTEDNLWESKRLADKLAVSHVWSRLAFSWER
jgi:hypothetical protein